MISKSNSICNKVGGFLRRDAAKARADAGGILTRSLMLVFRVFLFAVALIFTSAYFAPVFAQEARPTAPAAQAPATPAGQGQQPGAPPGQRPPAALPDAAGIGGGLTGYAAGQMPELGRGVFEPTGGDLSVEMLSFIFGGRLWEMLTGSSVAGAPVGVLGSISFVWNLAVLGVISLMMLMQVVTGIVAAGEKGEIGAGYTTWQPARILLVAAALAPVIGGYSLAQVGVMGAIHASIGVADAANSYLLRLIKTSPIVATPMPNSRELAGRTLKTLVCYRYLNQEFQKLGLGDVVKANGWQSKRVGDEYRYSYSFDGTGAFGLDQAAGICGSYQLTAKAVSTEGEAVATAYGRTEAERARAFDQLIRDLDPLAQRLARGEVQFAGEAQAAARPQTESQPATPAIGASGQQDGAGQFLSAVRRYEQAVMQAVASARAATAAGKAGEKWIEQADSQGWSTAGAFFGLAVARDAELRRVSQNAVRVSSPSLVEAPQKVLGLAVAKLAWTDKFLARVAPEEFGGRKQSEMAVTARGAAGGSTEVGDRLNAWVAENVSQPLVTWAAGAFADTDGSWNTNPLQKFSNIGAGIMATGAGVGVLHMAGAIAAEAASGDSTSLVPGYGAVVHGAKAFFAETKPYVHKLVLILGLAGAVLMTWVPLIPVVLWLFAILTWLLLCLEAVMSAPLWAAAHVGAGGEGVVNEQSKAGWIRLAELVARPVMMLAGLYGGLLVLIVANRFLGLVIPTIVASFSAMTGWWSVFGMAFLLLAFALIAFVMCQRAFSAIVWLPDKAAAWINGRVGDTGYEHHDAALVAGYVRTAGARSMPAGRVAGAAAGAAGTADAGGQGQQEQPAGAQHTDAASGSDNADHLGGGPGDRTGQAGEPGGDGGKPKAPTGGGGDGNHIG